MSKRSLKQEIDILDELIRKGDVGNGLGQLIKVLRMNMQILQERELRIIKLEEKIKRYDK